MLADDGVGVTLIDPGAAETNLFDADGGPYARGLARLTTPSTLTIERGRRLKPAAPPRTPRPARYTFTIT